jgi:hypothetical protein
MANTYLTRTPSSAGNRRTWTISTWVKFSGDGDDVAIFNAWYADSNVGHFTFKRRSTNEQLGWSQWSSDNYTNASYRDVNGWYHIVLAVDTTQSTASNRQKLYVNGEQVTSFSTSYTLGLNEELPVNNNNIHTIGINKYSSISNYFNGSMSHFHMIDGTAYDATAFGETDSTTGEWTIKTSPSVTYGTNGFFILKDGNSVTDQSGNSNNWTVGGGTLTKTEDCPDNVFATFNPLASKVLGTVGFTLENGSTVLNPSSNTNQWTTSTICTPSTGKFYWEMKSVQGSATDWPDIGFMFTDSISTHMANSANTQHNFSYATAIESNGTKWDFGTQTTSWFGGFGNGDIISCAVDVNAGKFWWGVNGSWLNSGDPANGTNHGSNFTAGTSITAWVEQYNAGDVLANFGNGYFGTTAVSSAGTNASGIGIFEYDVPAGFTALSTKGLNL